MAPGLQIRRKRVKGVADIVICVDVTGSMTPCIERLLANLSRFVTELEAARAVPDQGVEVRVTDWRARVLAFRDLPRAGRLPAMVEDLPFVDNVPALAEQLTDPRLKAGEGGGDGPESSLDALYRAALRSEWRPDRRAAHRFVVLFTDATPLPTLHESTVGRGAPDDLDALLQALREANVAPVVFGPRAREYERVVALRPDLAPTSRLFENHRVAREFFRTEDIGFEGLIANLAASISQSSSVFL